jgi:predicted O-methyltransferase YrrM
MAPGGPGEGILSPAEPRAKDQGEEKILKAIDEINRQQGRMMNVPPVDGRLLRMVAESIGAKKVVEIGTSNGISAIWISLALRKTGGRLITHEIDPGRAALARKNFAAVGVEDLVTVVEGDAHKTVSALEGPIDMIFLDADKEGYLDYLKKLLPLVRPGGMVLAHNMTPRMANPEFVKAITTNPELETLYFTAGGGMSMTLKKR